LRSTKDFDKTDSFLLEGLVSARAKLSQNVVDEQIETTFKDLYGYSPVLKDLLETMGKFEYIDWLSFSVLYRLTGNDISLLRSNPKENEMEPLIMDIMPFKLASRLRITVGMFRHVYNDLVSGEIDPFCDKLIRLINKNDNDIYNKKKILIESDSKRLMAQCFALKGLEQCLNSNWRDSGLNFCEAIELYPTIPGFWAGAGLALHCLNNDQDAKPAFQMVRMLIGRRARSTPQFISGELNYNSFRIKIENALERVT
jgi:hypothetical protein